MRRSMLAAVLVAAAGCGGGGDGDTSPPVTIAWTAPSYTVTLPTTLTSGTVQLGGRDLPPIMAISLSGPVGGVPPYWMNSFKQVPVTLVAPSSGRGSYTVTASATVNGVTYSASTQLVVQ